LTPQRACVVYRLRLGMSMGSFNSPMMIPQRLSGLSLGYFLTRYVNGSAVMMLVLGGVPMPVAAMRSQWGREEA
jgi:hypothetical protein